MSALKIRIFPDSILRKKAKKIPSIGDIEKKELSEMAKAMYLAKGVGLAAVQVGIDKQLAVIDIGDGLIKMANPAIVKKEGSLVMEEGCLSVPEVCVKVKRANSIIVNYLDESGQARQLRATGLLARAVQHEIDHLCGTLIIDYTNPVKKIIIKRRLSRKKSTRNSPPKPYS